MFIMRLTQPHGLPQLLHLQSNCTVFPRCGTDQTLIATRVWEFPSTISANTLTVCSGRATPQVAAVIAHWDWNTA